MMTAEHIEKRKRKTKLRLVTAREHSKSPV